MERQERSEVDSAPSSRSFFSAVPRVYTVHGRCRMEELQEWSWCWDLVTLDIRRYVVRTRLLLLGDDKVARDLANKKRISPHAPVAMDGRIGLLSEAKGGSASASPASQIMRTRMPLTSEWQCQGREGPYSQCGLTSASLLSPNQQRHGGKLRYYGTTNVHEPPWTRIHISHMSIPCPMPHVPCPSIAWLSRQDAGTSRCIPSLLLSEIRSDSTDHRMIRYAKSGTNSLVRASYGQEQKHMGKSDVAQPPRSQRCCPALGALLCFPTRPMSSTLIRPRQCLSPLLKICSFTAQLSISFSLFSRCSRTRPAVQVRGLCVATSI